MADWSFLTNHARALLCIAHDPDTRLRDIANLLDVTERTAFGIVADLAEDGYVLKERVGRRTRYQIRAQMPLREAIARERSVGEMLALLVGTRGSKPARKARS